MPCTVCVRHAVSNALDQLMQHKRRLKGLLGASLQKISFYLVKIEDYVALLQTDRFRTEAEITFLSREGKGTDGGSNTPLTSQNYK